MKNHGFFDHNDHRGRGPAERVQLFDKGSRYTLVGENIAAGYPSVGAACRGWMNSSGHRANILRGGYTAIGGGFARGGSWARYYVQVFADSEGGGDDPGDGPTPPPVTPPTSPIAPPTSDTNDVSVQFGPGDDSQHVWLNGVLRGSVGYSQSGSFNLGALSASDRVQVATWNELNGFVWNVRVYVDGVQLFAAQEGDVGVSGACGNAQQPNNAYVFTATLDYAGNVLQEDSAC